MSKSIGLGVILSLCLGLCSQHIRGDPVPDCGQCDCAHSTAWRETNETGYFVLTTQPKDNPKAYGDPVSTAHWFAGVTKVYSWQCLDDYHQTVDSLDYNKWRITNVSWQDNCNVLQQQQGWFVVAIGTGGNKNGQGTDSRYDCGPQQAR